MKERYLIVIIVLLGLLVGGLYWKLTSQDESQGHALPPLPEPALQELLPLDEGEPLEESTTDLLQLGTNFIRFFWTPEDNKGPLTVLSDDPVTRAREELEWADAESIFSELESIGAQAYRQLAKADLMWAVIEPEDDQWNFAAADEVFLSSDGQSEPIVTLFAMQYASGTPPWITDPAKFDKTLGLEAQEYLEVLIDRYGEEVTYWEIGNEMDHWSVLDDSSAKSNVPSGRIPEVATGHSFTPVEQGKFYAQVAAFIRERDEDAVIVMPGLGGLHDYALEQWIPGVIEGGGTDWFDVVNYHHYGAWDEYLEEREALAALLQSYGIEDKPVWLTETGSTADPTLTNRTRYPNSERTQAADVFRRIVQAWGAGDELVLWHSFIGALDSPTNTWRGYALIDYHGESRMAHEAFTLLSEELVPFKSVERIEDVSAGQHVYRVTVADGAEKYVAWGEGRWRAPIGMSEYASVVMEVGSPVLWNTVHESIELTEEPVLVR